MIKTLKSKLEQFIRILNVNTITRYNGSILIVEFPKSGGTWLGQLISGYMNIPFPRNKFPGLGKSIYHSHYLPKYSIHKNKKIVFLVRDGRDVMVSLYFHQLIWNEKNKLNPKDVKYHRSNLNFLDFENVKENMKKFIEYSFNNKPSKFKQFTFMGNWYDYNNKWLRQMEYNTNIYMIKYEDLLNTPYETLSKMFETFLDVNKVNEELLTKTINRYSFKNQSKREQGEENKNSFLRKGIAGDWKNYFGEEEKELFKAYTKSLLIELGYETDVNW